MQRRLELHSVLLATATLAACASPPSANPPRTVPAALPTVAAEVGPPVSSDSDEPAIALPPAPAPGEIVLHVRWRDPRATLATMAAYAGLPASFVDQHMKQGAQEVVRQMVGDKVDPQSFAQLIDASAPVDFVVAVDISGDRPKQYLGMSVGLTSLPKALAASRRKAKKLGDGVWQLEAEEPWGQPCAVLSSSGRTRARLVCGEQPGDLTALGPYLARTLPTLDIALGDIHASVKLRGLLDRYGHELATRAKGLPDLAALQKIGIPQFDEALINAATAIGDEVGPLVRDLDHASADAKIDAHGGLTIAVRIGFTGKTSWTVERIFDGADLAAVAPDLFWRAPKKAVTAAYGFSADPTRFASVMNIARALLEGKLTEANIATAADRKAIAALVRLVGGKHVAVASSSGYFDSASAGTGPTAGTPRTPGAPSAATTSPLASVVNAVIGWHLHGFEESSQATTGYLNELVKVYNRPTLQAFMKRAAGSDAKLLPTVKVVPAPAALGPGSLDVEVAVSNLDDPIAHLGAFGTGKKSQPVRLSLHVLVMADGKRTWLGLAADRDKLAQLMANAKGQSSGAGADSISSLPHLGPFRRDKHNGAAFFSLKALFGIATLAQQFSHTMPVHMAGPFSQLLAAIGQMPNQGEAPITFVTDVTDGARPSSTLTLSIPKETLADIGFVVNRLTRHLYLSPPAP